MSMHKVGSQVEREQGHTPGPWSVDAVFPDAERGHTFEPVVSISAYSKEFDCKIRLADIPDVADEQSEEYANAQLIAAAPDMLAALKSCLDVLYHVAERENNEAGYAPVIQQAEAAIAKAEVTR